MVNSYISRRMFLKGAAVLCAAPLGIAACGQQSAKSWIIAGSDDDQGKHRLSVINSDGVSVFSTPIDQRVHGQAVNPAKPHQVIFFARRPGTKAYVLNLQSLAVEAQFNSGNERHFFGHGTFSKDGQYAFSCENNYAKGEGVIVVRDTKTWKKVDEFPAYGIGTHQIELMPGGKHLVVANGGIQTHPDQPRVKLNIKTMKPSLSYIEVESGKHIASYYPSHHQMSIRHLDVASNGTVGVAMQYQGNKKDVVPLIAFHSGENQLQYAQSNDIFWRRMKQYTASIALDDKGQVAVVTTPRGNAITFWDVKSGKLLSRDTIMDVAGVSYSKENNGFVATTGHGDMFVFSDGVMAKANAEYHQFSNTRWDNHLMSVQPIGTS